MSIFASAAGLRPRMLLLGILLILIGGATLAVKSGDSFRFDDELRYHDLAHSLLHNHAYATQGGAPTAWWPPGYPFAISGVYAVWDRPLAAKFLNVACLALAVFGAALLAGRQHRNGILVTPYMALCYPIFFYTASCLYPQTLGSLLLVIVIGIVSNPPFSRAGAVLAGLTYGLLCLTIPAFMLLLPLVLVFIMLA